MTWPFENDTGSAIRKLASKNLKTDKTRNTLLVITIALATCLILTAILYFGGSKRASLRDAAGRYQASITLPDAEAARTLENDRRITAGFSYLPGMLDYGDYKVTLRSMDGNLMRLAKYPAMEGKLPEAVNEIAVTQAFLTRENLECSLGDTLLLDLGDGEQPYRICGILPDSDSNYSIYISASYAQSRCETPLYVAYIHVPGTDGWPEDAIKAQILDLSGEWGIDTRNIDFSTYYFSLIRQRSAEYMAVIALIVLTVTLACALVIYSLFFISVTRKTREYGRLRAIGATGRQVRKMVFQEGRRLSARAIPIGLVTGTVAGYALVPKGWNLPLALAAGAFVAALMYLCVMLTVSRPARTASRITPIEATRCSASDSQITTKSTRRLSRPLSTGRLALLNFARNRKKSLLTMASLSVCGIILMVSSAYFHSIDPVNMARTVFPYGQVRIELGDYGPQSHNSRQYSDLQRENPLSNQVIEQIASMGGVENVRIYRGTVLNMSLPTGYESSVVAEAFPQDRQALLDEYLIAGTADPQTLGQNNGIVIKQIDQWEKLFGWEVSVGDRVTLETGFGDCLEATVMGIVDESIPYGGYELLFMPPETLSALMPATNLNYQLLLDTKDGEWPKVREEVRKLFPQNARVYVTTLNDWVETYRKLLANYRTPVYIFVLLIGAFGTINLLNTLITNMLVRRRELGIMQAVGLSGRQLSRLLMAEGLLYTLGVYVLSVALGAPLGRLLCRVFSAMSVFGAVEYRFPLLEMTAFLLIMLVIQVTFSLVAIRLFRKKSLVDQIRELA